MLELLAYLSWGLSKITNSLQPAKTMFFAISIPRAPTSQINILLSAYFATASMPIAPMYLLHLSLTFSS